MSLIGSMIGAHKWKYTHRSGCERECVVCGTKESKMMAWVTPPISDWWETVDEGDVSAKPCGGRHFKPPVLGVQ